MILIYFFHEVKKNIYKILNHILRSSLTADYELRKSGKLGRAAKSSETTVSSRHIIINKLEKLEFINPHKSRNRKKIEII